jgi:hypothetical protein
MTPEEWIARGVAPVKAQYLKPAAPAAAETPAAAEAAAPDAEVRAAGAAAARCAWRAR